MLRSIFLITTLLLLTAVARPNETKKERGTKSLKTGSAQDSGSAGLYLFGSRDEKAKERYEGHFSDSKYRKGSLKRKNSSKTPSELSDLDEKALKELHDIQNRDDLTKKQYYHKIDDWAKKQGDEFYKKFSKILERYGERRKFLNKRAQIIFESLQKLYARCREIMLNDALTKKEMLEAFNDAFKKANRWSVTALKLIEFGAKRDYYSYLRRQRLFTKTPLKTSKKTEERPKRQFKKPKL
uniref:DUF148 domain-containing protein n=1 Tax=Syphacia muris TaxID=451379 RepID=A0A0N5ANM0_9BILA